MNIMLHAVHALSISSTLGNTGISAAPTSARSLSASKRRSFDTEIHKTRVPPLAWSSLIMAAICRPLPTPAPSPRKKPAVEPACKLCYFRNQLQMGVLSGMIWRAVLPVVQRVSRLSLGTETPVTTASSVDFSFLFDSFFQHLTTLALG